MRNWSTTTAIELDSAKLDCTPFSTQCKFPLRYNSIRQMPTAIATNIDLRPRANGNFSKYVIFWLLSIPSIAMSIILFYFPPSTVSALDPIHRCRRSSPPPPSTFLNHPRSSSELFVCHSHWLRLNYHFPQFSEPHMSNVLAVIDRRNAWHIPADSPLPGYIENSIIQTLHAAYSIVWFGC